MRADIFQSLCLSLFAPVWARSTYRFTGNPYRSTTDVARSANLISYNQTRSSNNPPPFGTEFYYPEKDGVYPLVIFLGGVYGLVPGNIYDEYLSALSRKGFVIASSTAVGHMRDMKEMEIWNHQFDWNVVNANTLLQEFAEESSHLSPKQLDIEIDPTKIMVACQSAGCEVLKYLANEKTDYVLAYHMLDPVPGLGQSSQEIVNHQVVTSAGVMIQSTEFCGPCCLNKWANQPIWDAFTSNDVKMFEDQLHTGHCSCLDVASAKACSFVCNAEEEYMTLPYLKKVHTCDTAKATAFFTDAIWNDSSMRTYYQESNKHCDVELVDPDTMRCQGPKCQ